MNPRRRLFASAACCAPFALGFTPLLAACARANDLPDGMEPIVWDRDACSQCKMVISDRRFAVEVRSGAKNELHKFDDIGCAVTWLRAHGEDASAAAPIWVADAASRPEKQAWLDARRASYVARSSPMGYDFGAVALPEGGALAFDDMRDHVLARGR